MYVQSGMIVFFEIVEMDMKERDSMRSKLYAAERIALIPHEIALPSVKDVERYLVKQSKRKTLITRYGTAVDLKRWPIKVKDGGGTRHAYAYGTHSIGIPLWARNDRVVLHEWAHIIHDRLAVTGYGRKGTRTEELQSGAAHGWQYVAIYLDLVRFCMGHTAWADFKKTLKSHKVRWRAKRPRSATPKQVERLALARAARKRDK